MASSQTPITASTTLGLRQYTKDVPPGWRPRSYPINEYKDLLGIWGRLTKLDPEQVGPAIMSRLEHGALKVALKFRVSRRNPTTGADDTFTGPDAVALLDQPPIMDPVSGAPITPHYRSGASLLLDRLMELYHLDDQDQAWTAIDKFMSFQQGHDMDFSTYLVEWDRLFDDAESLGGLSVNDVAKCWLFFQSQSTFGQAALRSST